LISDWLPDQSLLIHCSLGAGTAMSSTSDERDVIPVEPASDPLTAVAPDDPVGIETATATRRIDYKREQLDAQRRAARRAESAYSR